MKQWKTITSEEKFSLMGEYQSKWCIMIVGEMDHCLHDEWMYMKFSLLFNQLKQWKTYTSKEKLSLMGEYQSKW